MGIDDEIFETPAQGGDNSVVKHLPHKCEDESQIPRACVNAKWAWQLACNARDGKLKNLRARLTN